MATSVELRQQRARTVEAMRAITERAEGENRDLNGEETSQYEQHRTDFASLSGRITRQEELEQADADNAAPLHPAGSANPDGVVDQQNDEQRSRQRRAAFLAFARRGVGGLTREQRALVENAVGEILVPEDLEAEIYRELPNVSVIRPLASVRNTTSDRVRKRSLTDVTVAWGKLETGAELVESELTPSEAWIYVEDLYGLAKIGEDELADSDINLEQALRDSFTDAIAEAEDAAYVKGTGHANSQPQGIFAAGTGIDVRTSGATTYGGTGANAPGVLLDDLVMLGYDLKAGYRKNGAYLLNSTSEALIATTKDGNGQYLWKSSIAAGRPNTFNGYPLYAQDDIEGVAAAKAVAAFGDFNAGYRIYDRLGMTMQRLVELYAEDGLVGFKVHRRVGAGVIRPKAIKILKTKA